MKEAALPSQEMDWKKKPRVSTFASKMLLCCLAADCTYFCSVLGAVEWVFCWHQPAWLTNEKGSRHIPDLSVGLCTFYVYTSMISSVSFFYFWHDIPRGPVLRFRDLDAEVQNWILPAVLGLTGLLCSSGQSFKEEKELKWRMEWGILWATSCSSIATYVWAQTCIFFQWVSNNNVIFRDRDRISHSLSSFTFSLFPFPLLLSSLPEKLISLLSDFDNIFIYAPFPADC